MSSLPAAQAEWEAATIPYPLFHKQSYGAVVEEPFRRYGDAIAWLEWQEDCEIEKIETLKPRAGGLNSDATAFDLIAATGDVGIVLYFNDTLKLGDLQSVSVTSEK
jgi:hypothetical protein